MVLCVDFSEGDEEVSTCGEPLSVHMCSPCLHVWVWLIFTFILQGYVRFATEGCVEKLLACQLPVGVALQAVDGKGEEHWVGGGNMGRGRREHGEGEEGAWGGGGGSMGWNIATTEACESETKEIVFATSILKIQSSRFSKIQFLGSPYIGAREGGV